MKGIQVMAIQAQVNKVISSTKLAIDQKTQKNLLDLICAQLRVSITAAFFGGMLLVISLWEISSQQNLVNWFSCFTVITVIRYILCRAYLSNAIRSLSASQWINIFTFTTMLAGLTWGCGIMFLKPANPSIYEMLVATTYCALAAGSVTVLAPIKKISVAFLLSSLVPFIIWQFWQMDRLHVTLGIMATIYLVVLLLVLRNINKAIYDSIKLQYENIDLIENLSRAHERMEQANYELSNEVKERQTIEQFLRASEEQLKLITNNLPVLIAYFDTNHIFQFNNKAYEDWFGKPIHKIQGQHLREIFDSDIYQIMCQLCQKAMAGKQVIQDFNLRHWTGRIHNITSTLIPHFANDNVIGFFSLITDITERKKAEQRLIYLATHDTLTGLANRSLFYAEANKAISRTHRSNKKLALFYLDLDNFKKINDSLGHDVGDQLLIKASKRIKSVIRESDALARLGGDEFTILIEDLNTIDNATVVAGKLCNALAEAFTINQQMLFVTASIGISVYPEDGATITDLLKSADLAMYRAKDQNGNTYQLYENQMNAKLLRRVTLENSLRHALELQQFQLFYQPVFKLDSKLIVGAEALIRWQHPTLGLISPAEFISIAEETGLIVPIGEWVLKTACTQAKEWQKHEYADLRLAVNLSARQFYEPSLVEMVDSALNITGFNSQHLDLELTESLVMHSMEQITTLKNLKQRGIGISIDDFGTGYSSLSYLKDLPIDTLKIDRSFVNGIPDSATILASIITMAHNLGLRIIAEGVESEYQLEYLKKQRCQFIQGYIISPPVDSNQFSQLLNNSTMPLMEDNK